MSNFASHIDEFRRTMFSTSQPEMPPDMLEYYRIIYLYRRKYSHPEGLSADELFEPAARDMEAIGAAYNHDETMVGLLVEAYNDIERQYKACRAAHQAN